MTAVKDEQDVVLESEEDWREHTDPSGFAYFSRRDPGGLHWALARAGACGKYGDEARCKSLPL